MIGRNSWSKADELVEADDSAYMPVNTSKKIDDPSQRLMGAPKGC